MKNRLRALRAERAWTQTDLGRRVGVSRQAISAIESGRYVPSLTLALKTARAFGRTIEEIYQLEEGD